MEEYLYTPLDIATIICNWDIGTVKQSEFIKFIWEKENSFLLPVYRSNLKKFTLDIMFQMNYMGNTDIFNQEFPVINKTLKQKGSGTTFTEDDSDFETMNLFFKNLRLRILYLDTQDFVRLKLRTLLSQYGYKKRSKQLLQYLERSLYFYHLQPYLRGGEECIIDDIKLDDMITFRVI